MIKPDGYTAIGSIIDELLKSECKLVKIRMSILGYETAAWFGNPDNLTADAVVGIQLEC